MDCPSHPSMFQRRFYRSWCQETSIQNSNLDFLHASLRHKRVQCTRRTVGECLRGRKRQYRTCIQAVIDLFAYGTERAPSEASNDGHAIVFQSPSLHTQCGDLHQIHSDSTKWIVHWIVFATKDPLTPRCCPRHSCQRGFVGKLKCKRLYQCIEVQAPFGPTGSQSVGIRDPCVPIVINGRGTPCISALM